MASLDRLSCTVSRPANQKYTLQYQTWLHKEQAGKFFDKTGLSCYRYMIFLVKGKNRDVYRITLFWSHDFLVCSLFYLLKDCSGCILYSFIAYFAGTFLFFRIFDVCSLVLFVIVISSIFYKNERCHVYRVLLSTSSKPCLSNKVIYILDVPFVFVIDTASKNNFNE